MRYARLMTTAAPTAVADTLYLGLKLYEWLTLAGVFAGPLSAVLITLGIERRRRQSDARMQVLRMIMTTRRLPSDPAYNVAINMVELEFNDRPDVMTARREYLDLVRMDVAPERQLEHQLRVNAKQATMIYGMMRAVGLKASESTIHTDAYVSQGFVDRDNIYLESLRAMPDVAAALQVSNRLMAHSMGLHPDSVSSVAPAPVADASPASIEKTQHG